MSLHLEDTAPDFTAVTTDGEIIRVLDALHATDRDPIATPADWRPGDRVIMSPSMSTDDANYEFDNVEEIKPYLRYADAPAT